MYRVSPYQSEIAPANLNEIDNPLIAVGLAQYPQKPSIMDSINKPVRAPAPVVMQRPEVPMAPGPAPAVPMSSPMAPGPAPAVPMSSPMAPTPVSPAPAPMIPAPAPQPMVSTYVAEPYESNSLCPYE